MAVELKVKSGGSWRTITQPEVKSGGIWRQITTIEVKSGGVWREVFTLPSGVVTVSGETISSQGIGFQTATVIFRADGTTDKFTTQTGTTQIDVATDWIIPNDAADSTYEVRYTSLVGDAFTFFAAAEDVWVDLGSDRQWGYRDTNSNFFVLKTGTATFEIRKDGGAVIASATYSITANMTTF